MARAFVERTVSVIGYRMPMSMALVAGLTIVLTLATGVLIGSGSLTLATLFVLVPELVLHGQVWRLVTWAFVELSWPPIGLLFVVAAQVLWFGPELNYRWGPRWFLKVYFGFVLVIGAILTLLGLASPAIARFAFTGAWPVLTALIVAWALQNPHAQIRFMFFLPANGRQIIWITLALIVTGAILNSPLIVLPDFIAFVLALVYFKDPMLMEYWYRLRLGLHRSGTKRRPSHLRPVDDNPRWYH